MEWFDEWEAIQPELLRYTRKKLAGYPGSAISGKEAEDFIQELFEKILSGERNLNLDFTCSMLEQITHLKMTLKGLISNAAKSKIYKNRNHNYDFDETVPTRSSVDESELAYRKLLIEKICKSLPIERWRKIFDLYRQGYQPREIGKKLNLTAEAVNTNKKNMIRWAQKNFDAPMVAYLAYILEPPLEASALGSAWSYVKAMISRVLTKIPPPTGIELLCITIPIMIFTVWLYFDSPNTGVRKSVFPINTKTDERKTPGNDAEYKIQSIEESDNQIKQGSSLTIDKNILPIDCEYVFRGSFAFSHSWRGQIESEVFLRMKPCTNGLVSQRVSIEKILNVHSELETNTGFWYFVTVDGGWGWVKTQDVRFTTGQI